MSISTNTDGGDDSFAIDEHVAHPGEAAHYLNLVRLSTDSPDSEVEPRRLIAAIIGECREQVSRLGGIDTTSFTWLQQHPRLNLDELFPAQRAETHDRENFPRSIGHFMLVGVLGSGGYGTVYHAVDLSYGRPVALKTLNVGAGATKRQRRVMVSEAEALQRINCANVVRVYGVHRIGLETVIAMQLIQGTTLSRLLKQDGPLSREKAAEMVRQSAVAIAAAHRSDLVHRDLKPGNLLTEDSSHWYVADFGLAKRLDKTMSHSSPNHLRGTEVYASPEQLEMRDATPRTDIFALGLILFEAVTGQRAFEPSSGEERFRKIMNQEGIWTRENKRLLGQSLTAIVAKCLQPFPEHRYENAERLQLDLANFLAGKPVSVRPPSLWAELKIVFRQRKKTLAAIIACATTAVAALVLWMNVASNHRLGRVLQRQGLLTSAAADLNRIDSNARDGAIKKIAQAAAIRTNQDGKELLNKCVEAMLKNGLSEKWTRAGNPTLGFDVSGDGRWVAMANEDGSVSLVDRQTDTNKIIPAPETLPDPSAQPVLFLELTDGGRYLAAMHHLPSDAAHDVRRPFYVWNTVTLERLESVSSGIQDDGWSFTWDQRSIVVADSRTNEFHEVNLAQDRIASRIPIPHGNWVRGIASNQSAEWIAVAWANTRIVQTIALARHPDKQLGDVIDHWEVPSEIADIDVSRCGLVAVGSGKDAVLFATGRAQATTILHAHDTIVDQVRFSRRGDRLLTHADDNDFAMWRVDNGSKHLMGVSTRHVEFVSGDREIAGVIRDDKLAVDSVVRDQLRPTLVLDDSRGGQRAVCFDASGSTLFVASNDGLVAWKIDSGVPHCQIVDRLVCGSVDRIGNRLLSTHRFHVALRDASEFASSERKIIWTHDHHYGSPLAVSRSGNCVVYHQKATGILTALRDSETVDLAAGNANVIGVSHDGRFVASSGWELDADTRIWDLSNETEMVSLPDRAASLTFLSHTPILVIGTAESYQVCDLETGQQLQHFDREFGTREAPCTTTPDGQLLAMMLSNREITIYDPLRWEPVLSIPAPSSNVLRLTFSDSGNRLAALLQNGTVIVWRLDALATECQSIGINLPLAAMHSKLELHHPIHNDNAIWKRFRECPPLDWFPNATKIGDKAAPIHRKIEGLRAEVEATPNATEKLTALAHECLLFGGLGEAAALFASAHEISPNTSSTYFAGLLHLTLDNELQFQTLIDNVDLNSLHADGQSQSQTRLCLLRPQSAKIAAAALESIDAQLSGAPQNDWLLNIKALALIRNRRPEEAITILRDTIGEDLGNYDSFEKAILSLAYRQSGNNDQCEKVLALFDRFPQHRIPDLRLYAQQLVDQARMKSID